MTMPANSEMSHANQPPRKDEALQYITYSAKELLYMLNEKVTELDNKIDSMALEQAKLDARYVTQGQFKEEQRQSAIAKRFAVTATIAAVGSFGTLIGVLVTVV